jgi:large subunit ribosomal protein L35
MPKMKTLKGAAKRFKRTGSGKLKRFRASKSHLLTGKAARRMRPLRKSALVHPADAKRMARLVPYL